MPNAPGTADLPRDSEVLAFVLRIRSEIIPPGRRMVVILDDVNAKESWHFNELDPAFAKIHEAVLLCQQDEGASGNPH